jgi:hypothetical protein
MSLKKLEIIKNDRITISLRKDFFDVFSQQIKDIFYLTGANYFAHQIIENYYAPNHFVSSFNTCEEWSDIYWDKYWDQDPIERKIHKNARTNGVSMSIWQVSDTSSLCMIKRKKIAKVEDGVAFSYQHKSGALENFTLAWNDFNLDDFDCKKVEIIQEKINPIRLHHHQVYQNLE